MNQLDSSGEIVGMRNRTSTSEGYAAVFATILIWSTPSLFQYYLNRYYDPWAQNFYRYLVACVSIAPFLIYRIRRREQPVDWRAITRRNLRRCSCGYACRQSPRWNPVGSSLFFCCVNLLASEREIAQKVSLEGEHNHDD